MSYRVTYNWTTKHCNAHCTAARAGQFQSDLEHFCDCVLVVFVRTVVLEGIMYLLQIVTLNWDIFIATR